MSFLKVLQQSHTNSQCDSLYTFIAKIIVALMNLYNTFICSALFLLQMYQFRHKCIFSVTNVFLGSGHMLWLEACQSPHSPWKSEIKILPLKSESDISPLEK